MPQLIGHKVPVNDPVWSVYLLLREVCAIIFATAIDRESLVYLADLIAKFLTRFIEVFGACNVKPKMHYLVHYPRYIALYGGLKQVSTVRFESLHFYFKKVARSTNCYKNVCQTLAKRHQLRQCWEWEENDVLKRHDIAIGRTKSLSITSAKLPDDVRNIIFDRILANDVRDDEM